MSFFVSDNLKNVISEEDLVERSSKDVYLCLDNDDFKKEYFIRSYKNESGVKAFIIETTTEITELFKADNSKIRHTVLIGNSCVLKGEGILEIKEFNQQSEENLISCKIVIKQRGIQ